MKTIIFFIVLAFATLSYCYHRPILNCGYRDTSMRICASNGRTYTNECDFKQDKLFVDNNLHILYKGKCYDTITKEKHRYVEEIPPPRYVIEEDSEETPKRTPWIDTIRDIMIGKAQIAKDIMTDVKDTVQSLFNYKNKKIKKKITFKKNVKKGCYYCPMKYRY